MLVFISPQVWSIPWRIPSVMSSSFLALNWYIIPAAPTPVFASLAHMKAFLNVWNAMLLDSKVMEGLKLTSCIFCLSLAFVQWLRILPLHKNYSIDSIINMIWRKWQTFLMAPISVCFRIHLSPLGVNNCLPFSFLILMILLLACPQTGFPCSSVVPRPHSHLSFLIITYHQRRDSRRNISSPLK